MTKRTDEFNSAAAQRQYRLTKIDVLADLLRNAIEEAQDNGIREFDHMGDADLVDRLTELSVSINGELNPIE